LETTGMIEEQDPQPMIEAMLDQLEHGSVAERRAAAYYLGESASEESIEPLITAYHDDKNRSVRQAAAYALGMYRAVDLALTKGENDRVVGLLEQVARGELGRRAPIGRWFRRILGLLLALVVLGGLNLYRDNIRVLLFPNLARDKVTIAREIDRWFTTVQNDVTALQNQFYSAISSGGQVDCTTFFNEPAPFPPLPGVDALTYPEFVSLIDRMNGVRSQYSTAKARFNAVCVDGNPLTSETAALALQEFVPTVPLALELKNELQTIIENAPTATAAPPTETSVPVEPTAAPAVVPTAEPPTVEPPTPGSSALGNSAPTAPNFAGESDANPARHLPALYAIIDNVTTARGASSLLLRYWQEVQSSGTTSGCEATRPSIPQNYIVLPEIDVAVSEELHQAVNLINIGLNALRDGWREFQTACDAGNMQGRVATGLPFAEAADAAFENAVPLLDRVGTGN